ncbi:hypothetical protein BRD56_05100 [Thermoplasmatales archaeon SW_10_69_26]|nr:MAG: hypothetical protein BRD56_05100 [Thermoplasmatales archaeon SW_10_69_26]
MAEKVRSRSTQCQATSSRFERERSSDRDLTEIQSVLLKDETRRAIVQALRRTPGQNKNQLSDRLGVRSSLVTFHLERLEERGLVRTVDGPQGREVLCFVQGDEHLWQEEATRILFGREPVRLVGVHVAQHPGCSSQAIADALNLTKVTVQHHLRSLLERDLVERLRLGRAVEYHPTEILAEWAQALAEAYDLPWRDE